MIIKANGKYYSNERPGCWIEIPESAISYGIYTQEPAPEVVTQIQAEIAEADRLDVVGLDPVDMCYAPEPHVDAVREKWGETYQAMRAYEDFRLCALESAGQ